MAIQPEKSLPSTDLFGEISAYLDPELQQVEAILHRVVEGQSGLIREVGDYIALGGGKKLRPIIHMLASRAYGRTQAVSPQLAAAVELIHIATLLHDDVIDKAQIRRGRPSVNARWGDDVAILMADYLYAASFELALHHLDAKPLKLICEVTRRMCEGEVFQIEQRGRLLSEDDYLKVISSKTAYLFSACSGLAGIRADLDSEQIAHLTAYGHNFGLAFQVTDDTLDYTAEDTHWGKTVGMDLADGKQTLPLILTLQSAQNGERERIEAILLDEAPMSPEQARAIHDVMQQYQAIDRSLAVAAEYADQACDHLRHLSIVNPTAHEYLGALAEFVVRRQY